MKIYIEILNSKKKDDVLYLKKLLESQAIKGLKKLEVETTKPTKGEMGAGWITKLAALFIGSSGPITKFAEGLVKYIENMRSEIRLVNENGEELIVSAKLNKDEIQELINNFFERSSGSTTTSKNKTKKK